MYTKVKVKVHEALRVQIHEGMNANARRNERDALHQRSWMSAFGALLATTRRDE